MEMPEVEAIEGHVWCVTVALVVVTGLLTYYFILSEVEHHGRSCGSGRQEGLTVAGGSVCQLCLSEGADEAGRPRYSEHSKCTSLPPSFFK